jgi:hypothetical protein
VADRRDEPSGARLKRPPADAPHHTAATRAGKVARETRLAAEMRANLLKRKRQQRARAGRPPPPD